MASTKLIKIDESTIGRHRHLDGTDECYYFYEYTVGQGYEGSAPNQFILNFKKSVLRRGLQEYRYKQQAIHKAASLIANIQFSHWNFVPVPPSKTKDHPEYDSRLIDTLQIASQANDTILWREFIELQTSHNATHLQDGDRKTPEQLEDLYTFRPFDSNRNNFVIFDDVVTSGAHFKAIKHIILRHHPNATVRGLFLARSVYPEVSFEALFGTE
ncbi:hypothetical protein [Idiomarina abyssalis]|uniref:hypothetical protein n=1 Tax=Idiomarina abyssalis TaxID=86102 RepID=UPI003A95040F